MRRRSRLVAPRRRSAPHERTARLAVALTPVASSHRRVSRSHDLRCFAMAEKTRATRTHATRTIQKTCQPEPRRTLPLRPGIMLKKGASCNAPMMKPQKPAYCEPMQPKIAWRPIISCGMGSCVLIRYSKRLRSRSEIPALLVTDSSSFTRLPLSPPPSPPPSLPSDAHAALMVGCIAVEAGRDGRAGRKLVAPYLRTCIAVAPCAISTMRSGVATTSGRMGIKPMVWQQGAMPDLG